MITDFAQLAWKQTWQVTLLAVVIAILVSLWGRNRPHLAHALWLAVLLKCVTPPLWSSPLGLFSQLQPAVSNADQEFQLEPAVRIVVAPNTQTDVDLDAVSRLLPEDFSLDDLAAAPASGGRANLDSPATPPSVASPLLRYLIPLIASVWMLGCVIRVTWTLARSLACWRSIQRAARPADPELLQTLDRLIRRLRSRRRVRLLISATRIGPAVVGLFRPTIVLPEVIVAGNSAHDLEPILAHELIHVRRGDLWIGCLRSVISGIWWFHPLVRGTCRALAREAERCVDEELIAELRCEPARYARTLLTVLELKQSLRPVPVFPGMKPVEITSHRLERIMSLRQGCRNRTPWWCWGALTVVLAATLPGRALVAVDEQGSDGGRKSTGRVERLERYYEVPELVEKLVLQYSVSNERALDMLVERLSAKGVSIHREEAATLRILASAPAHAELASLLAAWKESPCDQVRALVKIYTLPPALVESVVGVWNEPSRDSADAQATIPKPTAAPPENDPSVGRVKLFESQEADDLRNRLQQSQDVSILSVPQLMMLNGQLAQLEVGQERSFVVGFQFAKNGLKPKTTTVREGLRMELRPSLRSGNVIEIATRFELSTVSSVERTVAEFNDGIHTHLEQPRVSLSRIESNVKVKPEQTLVLGGPIQQREGSDPEAIIVVMQLKPVPEAPSDLTRTPESPDSASPVRSPARLTSMTAHGNRRELTLSLDQWTLQVRAQPAEGRPAELDFATRDNGTQVRGSGRVSFTLKSNRPIDDRPIELDAIADSVQIQETFDGTNIAAPAVERELRIVLDGKVQLKLPNAKITCDHGEFRVHFPAPTQPQNGTTALPVRAKLLGDVRLERSSANAGTVDSLIQAEQIQFSSVEGELLQLDRTSSKPAILPEPQTPQVSPPAAPVGESVPRPEARRDELAGLQTRSYAVADLVVPLPGTLKVPGNPVPAPSPPAGDHDVRAGSGLRINIPILSESNPPSQDVFRYSIGLQATESEPARSGASASPVVIDFGFPIQTEDDARNSERTTPVADLAPLQQLIESTIAPESWQAAGGTGQIQPYSPTLSLIIRQTPEIHQQIAALLTGLRREQDVQVSLELKLVRFADNDWLDRLNWTEPADALAEGVVISQERSRDFQKLDEVVRHNQAMRFPKVTLFNEQVAEFTLPQKEDAKSKPLAVAMGVVVDNDRRGIRLNLAWNTTNREEALAGARSYRLSVGDSLLIDVSREWAAAQNIQGEIGRAHV